MWIKPSMIICPVKVPVMVEFCPDASNATANSVERTPVLATLAKIPLFITEVSDKALNNPKNDGSFTAPDLKTATPVIKSNALTTKANDN